MFGEMYLLVNKASLKNKKAPITTGDGALNMRKPLAGYFYQ
ncbi:hypothetical protein VHA_003219 [Grimontia hollisae CIP 101886]|uniref:Uncharacterized protein n=1 Tax=Grimontia hollisae CIP 101886 TaxID=675812 RepID=D0IBU0_GRIHO|nr:hypothetical protein VHA_003219 [Grimontia hollisae CIP 101886]